MTKVNKEDFAMAVAAMGREPINPLGSCFDTAALTFIHPSNEPGKDSGDRLVHAIGTANFPGQEGLPLAHAWIEFDDPKRGRVAFDTIWGIWTSAVKYREALKVSYAVEYTAAEALAHWKRTNTPGPWDPKIAAVIKEIVHADR